MAEIEIKRSHQLKVAEIRGRIAGLADKICDRLGGSWDWQGDDAICEARGAKARVGYDDRSIIVEISLPKSMLPFRRKLVEKIDEYLMGFLDSS